MRSEPTFDSVQHFAMQFAVTLEAWRESRLIGNGRRFVCIAAKRCVTEMYEAACNVQQRFSGSFTYVGK